MKLVEISKYYFHITSSIILNIKKISRQNNYFLVELKNKTFFTIRNIMDLWTLGETYINRDYEKHGVIIGKSWIIVDIGAAFGDFSIFAAKKSVKNIIYAVEPLPSSQKILQQNIKINKLENIKIYDGAISSSKNEIRISEDKKNYGHSHVCLSSRRKVKARSLTDFLLINKITRCDLVKCDCEGSEYDIFNNLPPSTFRKINRIVMEYHLFTPDSKKLLIQLKNTLKNNKFNLKISPNPVHSNLGFLYASK